MCSYMSALQETSLFSIAGTLYYTRQDVQISTVGALIIHHSLTNTVALITSPLAIHYNAICRYNYICRGMQIATGYVDAVARL